MNLFLWQQNLKLYISSVGLIGQDRQAASGHKNKQMRECRISTLHGAKSTNESRQSVSKSLLLVRLESSKQALMSLCQAFCQVRCCRLSFIAQYE